MHFLDNGIAGIDFSRTGYYLRAFENGQKGPDA